MLCKKPFTGGPHPYGCGQCLPCRINRARQWQWRQYFESLMHEENCFVTLTYAPEHLPADQSLELTVVSDFLGRLRKRVAPRRFRYFYVGEYGEQTLRPHYHINLFGLSPSTPLDKPLEIHLSEAWSRGLVHIGEFNETTAAYTCGYVTKKLKDRKTGLLDGLEPEFARMSNRPGLGASAMAIIAKGISPIQLDRMGDVPSYVNLGKRKIPLSRYLIKRLREAVGFTPEYIESLRGQKSQETRLELLALLEGAINNDPSATLTTVYKEEVKQRIEQTEKRFEIWKKRYRL